jgi:hypothetical protein
LGNGRYTWPLSVVRIDNAFGIEMTITSRITVEVDGGVPECIGTLHTGWFGHKFQWSNSHFPKERARIIKI